MKKILSILLIFFLLTCSQKTQKNASHIEEDEKLISQKYFKNNERNEWLKKLDSTQLTYPKEVIEFIFSEYSKMKNVNNPIIATYQGYELHDYFYFTFKGEDGRFYDFGNGDNNLGDIPFFKESETNSTLIGKKFKIYWGWKPTSFNCCEGSMDLYYSDLPSILRIEYY